MGVNDVPAIYLIEETAEKIKNEIEQPTFVGYVKTGVHRERAPLREDWFYVRMASILYRTNKWNVIGTERLRSYYGGRQRRGVKTEHFKKASGKVIRSAVQKLEQAGYLEKAKPRGRKLTSKGQKLLNEMSKIVDKGLKEGKYIKKEKVKKDLKQAKEVHEALNRQTAPKKEEVKGDKK
ncbi:MAG: 40S ribosomal protein S19 [Candidatus ainarchaeum sp.]|nr:40S ribosomal protein S19 [Candidatus ainarchaeum sp.]